MTSKLVSSPSFCYITPTAYLKDFATASTTHLVLAHLVDQDQEYANFYRDRAQVNDFIMMDCSSYELKEPYSPERLIDLGRECGANAIVLPDYPFHHSKKTIEAAITYAPLFKRHGFKTFFVPQSEVGDLEDWTACYLWAANNPDIDIIGMSILGIPNALPNVDPAYARVVMTALLQDRGIFSKKHHHYLGLNAGPALEIPSLLRMNALDTIDSSNPVWMGILGHEYTKNSDSYLSTKKINMPVDFSCKMSRDRVTLERISRNVQMTQELFTGPVVISPWFAQE